MNENVFFILGASELLSWVFLFYLWFKLRALPSNEELDEDIDDLYLKVEKIDNDLQIYAVDLYDKIEGMLKPLSRRITSREYKEKDLSSTDPLPKSGMISLAKAKEHGFIK